MSKRFLCGDIGGTKTLLQLAEAAAGEVRILCKRHYTSRSFAGFAEMLRGFLEEAAVRGELSAACFAVAGPVVARQAALTNLPWRIDSDAIARDFSIPAVKLLNDYEAVALAIEDLAPGDWVTLQAGEPRAQAMRVVLGAGTGMGVAWLAWLQDRCHALATEAGHIDFAPANPLQIRLLESLQHQFGHVSVERLLSGAGLTRIFNFLQADGAEASDFSPVKLEGDSAATVTALASDSRHPVAAASLRLFVEIYGAYAGNLALAGLCRGGVYIAGGIAPKIINYLTSGAFMRAFRDKGRFAPLLHEIPVHVVVQAEAGLLGAQREALRMLDR